MSEAMRTKIERLLASYKSGALGGAHMPEDVHPPLPRDSAALLHYLTLGMCLNYQRNAYGLWLACTTTYADEETDWVFDPQKVVERTTEQLRSALLKHKVALQPNKHIENWQRVSGGIVAHGEGDVRCILAKNGFDIENIRAFIQSNKRDFPYLAGNKICNYWLYVLTQYTDLPLTNRAALSVAPDTHVIQASLKLGLISPAESKRSDVAELVAQRWQDVLSGTDLVPIDVHTPLWLWSRGGFAELEDA
ncbi:hypothetical protein [uncultured Maritalea sp.]|uniref:hypothetical protein n=1 Tax=uncultured Maritalea sp. TaxID=757249 RepID=UPI0026165449|nr:hypothetical protein [uncultured Maritalea sp.]